MSPPQPCRGIPYRLKAKAAPTSPTITVIGAPRATPALSSTWGTPVELAAAPDEEAAEDPASDVELELESESALDVELAEVDSVLVLVLVEVVSVSVEDALVLGVEELVEALVDEVLEASPVMLNCSDCARMPVFLSSLENRLIWKPWLVFVSYSHGIWGVNKGIPIGDGEFVNGVRTIRGVDIGGDLLLDVGVDGVVDEVDIEGRGVSAALVRMFIDDSRSAMGYT